MTICIKHRTNDCYCLYNWTPEDNRKLVEAYFAVYGVWPYGWQFELAFVNEEQCSNIKVTG